MIINHNLMAMNALRNNGINNTAASKAMQKLSSGLRINGASDDAAGLAISEKMRGQINGLDQASRNAQDGQSMVQTAEGALNETTSILQRMRTLAVQAGNDSNVTIDRSSIQAEMNQLSSEINRIGNTTEFNTQKLLSGNGAQTVAKTGFITNTNLASGVTSYTQALQTTSYTAAATAADSATFQIQGQNITINFAAANANSQASGAVYNVTGNAATVNVDSTNTSAEAANLILNALQKVILSNSTLNGGYSASVTGNQLTIQATSGGAYQGGIGSIGAATSTLTIVGGTSSVGNTTAYQASAQITTTSLDGSAVLANGGEGITIGGQTIQFYDGSKGAYTGNAIGVDVRATDAATAVVDAIVAQNSHLNGVTLTNLVGKLGITANVGGENGNKLVVADGGVSAQFTATFQVGANQGQQFNISINDMRSVALGVTSTTAGGTDSATGAKFVAGNAVTDGTTTTLREASLDVSSATNATNAVKTIDNAINAVSAERAKLGAYSNRLDHTVANLGTTSENMSSAESRIRDVDMASEMMNYQKNNVLAQAAQAMIAQANQQPQQVLSLLR